MLGMFVGVALGVTPQMPAEWRLVGLTTFLVAAAPLVIIAIRKRRMGEVMEDAACLGTDHPAEPPSDGADH
jgi:hypothetical protein